MQEHLFSKPSLKENCTPLRYLSQRYLSQDWSDLANKCSVTDAMQADLYFDKRQTTGQKVIQLV